MASVTRQPSFDDLRSSNHELDSDGDRFLRSMRGAAAALASGATLAGAAMLEPDARGYGTHEQLGLFDSCPAARSGECPSCGLVTSMVHGVRGNLVESLKAHGGGLPIVLALAWAFVIGIAELLPRRWPSARTRRWVAYGLALAIGVGMVATVAARMLHADTFS